MIPSLFRSPWRRSPLGQRWPSRAALVAPPDTGLPGLFDRLHRQGAVLVCAHRGGAVPGYPENALETCRNTLARLPAMLEVDVTRSADGVLVLMHDDTLDRTTTGSGPVAERTFRELRRLHLVDNDGRATPYRIPTLDDLLDWSAGRTVLALDAKAPVTLADLVDAVAARDAFDRVLFATYDLDDTIAVARRAPPATIAAPIEDMAHLDALLTAGVAPHRLLAWTGTEIPRPGLYAALAERGVKSAFATLGMWTGSWDNRIRMLGDDRLYRRITHGVTLVATDRYEAVARALPAAARITRALR
ncbi:glycerophosphoryl diester phosphodiesterase [Rhodothalassium salexigens DSM 2132]|uniref:Glycerophosphoryl diester phosphodiesterase n=1 Tax=Rhodothalassium salexigens DSM 2132 TaxID=1188247 RepID=A0A4R2PH49_RHOSA|nr:glycerophosphodiester phosphodiesterase family protein [Rhodothalassium salexigens]MBB4211501.1 glycerophosphoryl diester phosphodiesterase [Rhodothalassium salexigens DSM 2132]MBK1639738.1 hypothetical protein [Rhodothalassium salexigens DSM 2132]TCP34567.1 glycerophosphoryl diester phosphodiesterase [Rhodothalassium salexigens DSM 2132]